MEQTKTVKCGCGCGGEVTTPNKRGRERRFMLGHYAQPRNPNAVQKYPVGTRFGRLVIVERKGTSTICLCDCGNKKYAHISNLRNGHITSCGCYRKEVTVSRSTKHGSGGRTSKTNTFTIWCDMRKRCTNPKSKSYKNYGERGITFCSRWDDFKNFLADMGERPKGMTLERKDNDKGYSPDNCVWATRAEQNRNKRNNHFLTHEGKTQTLTEWSRELGIAHTTILRRLKKGMGISEALGRDNACL